MRISKADNDVLNWWLRTTEQGPEVDEGLPGVCNERK